MEIKVFLDELPKWENGTNKGKINWTQCIGMYVKVIYGDFEENVLISGYNRNSKRITIMYNNNEQELDISHFRRGYFGKLLNCKTREDREIIYKYSIGDIIEVSTGNIQIINYDKIKRKDFTEKFYIYKCLNDGYIGKMSESKLNIKNGCSVCSNRKVIKGINDLATTHSHLLDYFVDINEAYKNSFGSHNIVNIKCINCNYEKPISINKLTGRGFSCPKCGDGISYAEKFIFNLLQQLNVNFEIQKMFVWSDNKKYDFYLNNLNAIIETHGLQHYENPYSFTYKITLEDIKNNDNYKHKLAVKNDIEIYIVLDCRKGDMGWIKKSIFSSVLLELFDLSKINWLKCHEYACSSRVKEACNLWNGNYTGMIDVCKKMKLSRTTIIKYLKQGTKLGWCNYDPKKNMRESCKNNTQKRNII